MAISDLEIQELYDKINDLTLEKQRLQREVEELTAKLEKRGKKTGINGFIVRTPQPISGEFVGLMFKNGEAFLSEEKAPDIIPIVRDLGYVVEPVDNYSP
jgi:hypothetical protein